MKKTFLINFSVVIMGILLSFKSFAEEIISKASYYGAEHHGKFMANGKRFNMYALTAAHKHLKLGTSVKVTNTNNNKSVVVTITDRGPFKSHRDLDLSYAAFHHIANISAGVIPVKYVVVN